MKAALITLFPTMVDAVATTSMLGRARSGGHLQLAVVDLRPFGLGRYLRVDDSPYGGGPGMVLRPEPVFSAMEAALARVGPDARLILPSPQGKPFTQAVAADLAAEPRPIVFLCGHYEGMDERILDAFPFEEYSAGDVVLTGGELPALMMLDAAVRLLPGVLGNAESAGSDCFSAGTGGLLKHPQYTRPAEFRGMWVPDVLRSGDHGKIDAWRTRHGLGATQRKRPDLLANRAVLGGVVPSDMGENT